MDENGVATGRGDVSRSSFSTGALLLFYIGAEGANLLENASAFSRAVFIRRKTIQLPAGKRVSGSEINRHV
ncbi:hypothetical protein D0469_00355 [Peribacillus saganii]|uniref:Uncharacterized protein n=1 Tax=Peribacillus saganii TaxID=2303992 RepID=A0A372LTS8_9BACI|nr:hypothetical protein D0469_00355 [Peribacillus saganii]